MGISSFFRNSIYRKHCKSIIGSWHPKIMSCDICGHWMSTFKRHL